MKETIEDINSDIDLQYGPKIMDKNMKYMFSLFQARMKDGVLDDNIPVPSIEAVAKTILLLLDRPELEWETICREKRVKNVMEYLFIRAYNHYDEVNTLVNELLSKYVTDIPQQTLLLFLNMFNYIVCQNRPTRFADEILYPEKTEKIIETLHFLLQGEVGRGAALVMVCARDEGLIKNIAHATVVTEFKHVSKTAYNNYVHERFTEKEKKHIIGTLRTKIGYVKEDDGRITFMSSEMSRRSSFYSVWRFFKFFKG